jgi:hypothetical protein
MTSLRIAASGSSAGEKLMPPPPDPASGCQIAGSVPFEVTISRYFAAPAVCAFASDGSSIPMKGENNVSMPTLRVNSRRFQLRIMVLRFLLEPITWLEPDG